MTEISINAFTHAANNLSLGAKAAIALAVLVFIAAVLSCILCCLRRKKQQRKASLASTTTAYQHVPSINVDDYEKRGASYHAPHTSSVRTAYANGQNYNRAHDGSYQSHVSYSAGNVDAFEKGDVHHHLPKQPTSTLTPEHKYVPYGKGTSEHQLFLPTNGRTSMDSSSYNNGNGRYNTTTNSSNMPPPCAVLAPPVRQKEFL